MKKVLMVIFVLSLLGLLAVPVLAEALVDEGELDNEIGNIGGFRKAAVESPALAETPIEEGGPSNELTPPPETYRKAGGGESGAGCHRRHAVTRAPWLGRSVSQAPCWPQSTAASRAKSFNEL